MYIRKIWRNLVVSIVLATMCSLAVPLYGQAPYKVTKLIGDLNDTPESNKKSRQELVKMGREAVPGLVEEIKKYSSLKDGELFSAARCLRVLKEMNSDAGIPVATEMLSALAPKNFRETSLVPLSEALDYLSQFSDNKSATTAVYQFISQSPEKWRSKNSFYYRYDYGDGKLYNWEGNLMSNPAGFKNAAWHNNIVVNAIGVDVFVPLGNLVAKKHRGAANALRLLFPTLPYQLNLNLVFLHADGFTPMFKLFLFSGDATTTWIEPKGRPRMLLMKWFSDLGDREACKVIEFLLRSEQKDERDFVLIVLDKIAGSKGPVQGTDIEPSEPIPDLILLKNGDNASGVVLNKSFTIKTSYATLAFEPSKIERITIEGGGANVDVLKLKNGDTFSGVLQDEKVTLQLESGSQTEISKDKLKEIEFRFDRSKADEKKPK